MAEERSPPASPVCYLDEAANTYAGYLSVAEAFDLIRRWRAQAQRPDIAIRLMALLPPASSGAEQDNATGPLPPLADAALQAEIRRMLPQFRDDALHRALSEIADLL
ncbi:MAG TPA: hypothetical protein VN229_07425 [Terriglobales bacterium]|nr:hypothetical protein [Terriglobales bacterium]